MPKSDCCICETCEYIKIFMHFKFYTMVYVTATHCNSGGLKLDQRPYKMYLHTCRKLIYATFFHKLSKGKI